MRDGRRRTASFDVMSHSKKTWSDLSGTQRRAIVGLIAVQLTLLTAALTDLRRRPARMVNGDKRVWTAVSFINFVGPAAYFAFGRKR